MISDRTKANRGLFMSETVISLGPASGQPLDLSHLRRYTLGDARLEKEVLSLFLAQLPVTIAALKMAATDDDWRMAAHTIKGSGRAVGAWPLATVAEDAEHLTGSRNAVCCSDAVARIERAADEVSRYIQGAFKTA